MDAWWLNPQGHLRRSSPANEREVEAFMLTTNQTVECVLTHGIVVTQDYAMSIMVKSRTACVCGAAI